MCEECVLWTLPPVHSTVHCVCDGKPYHVWKACCCELYQHLSIVHWRCRRPRCVAVKDLINFNSASLAYCHCCGIFSSTSLIEIQSFCPLFMALEYVCFQCTVSAKAVHYNSQQNLHHTYTWLQWASEIVLACCWQENENSLFLAPIFILRGIGIGITFWDLNIGQRYWYHN